MALWEILTWFLFDVIILFTFIPFLRNSSDWPVFVRPGPDLSHVLRNHLEGKSVVVEGKNPKIFTFISGFLLGVFAVKLFRDSPEVSRDSVPCSWTH